MKVVTCTVNGKMVATFDMTTKLITCDVETLDFMDWGDWKKNSITYFDWLMYCYDYSCGKVEKAPEDLILNRKEY